jgi:hypothetical protein
VNKHDKTATLFRVLQAQVEYYVSAGMPWGDAVQLVLLETVRTVSRLAEAVEV